MRMLAVSLAALIAAIVATPSAQAATDSGTVIRKPHVRHTGGPKARMREHGSGLKMHHKTL